MRRNHCRNLACITSVAVVIGQLLIGCAGTSSHKSLIKEAREFANRQGINAAKYSATLRDDGDEYFVFFERRALFHSVGDFFAVSIDKERREYRLIPGL